MPEFEKLQNRLKSLRLKLKENQEDFAYHCDTSVETISLIERGKTDVRLSTLQKIATYTGLTVSELLDTSTPDLPPTFVPFNQKRA